MAVSSVRLSRIRSQLPVDEDSSSDLTAERRSSWLLVLQAAVLPVVFFMAAVSSVGPLGARSRLSAGFSNGGVSQLVWLSKKLMWVPASPLTPFLSRSKIC